MLYGEVVCGWIAPQKKGLGNKEGAVLYSLLVNILATNFLSVLLPASLATHKKPRTNCMWR